MKNMAGLKVTLLQIQDDQQSKVNSASEFYIVFKFLYKSYEVVIPFFLLVIFKIHVLLG
jgi:hypothetical protein